MSDKWKVGNEFAPYHPNASHVEPGYRDGWNACYKMATAAFADACASLEAEIIVLKDNVKEDEKFLVLYGKEIGALRAERDELRDEADRFEKVRRNTVEIAKSFQNILGHLDAQEAELERLYAELDEYKEAARKWDAAAADRLTPGLETI